LNSQSFINIHGDAGSLRTWIKVVIEVVSLIVNDYKDHEFLDLLLIKLPWFNNSTTHGQNFHCFVKLALAVFPHDVSYIEKGKF
jgi:hypothetical protein